MVTEQEAFWKGEFGRSYTERNDFTAEQWDQQCRSYWGKTKIEINKEILDGADIDPESDRILEVGCNIGLQLEGVKRQGFKSLYGIDVQWYALEKATERLSKVSLIQGSASDLPFRSNYFDLVMTNGLLIHISPDNLPHVLDEIVRVSKRYVMGFEYYSDHLKEIPYRGNKERLWKGDYASLYAERQAVREINRVYYPYINEAEKGNMDCGFLLLKE